MAALAGLVDATTDGGVLETGAVLDVADDALGVDEEGLRQLEDAVLPRDGTVEVQQRSEAVERERIHEAADARALLEEVDREERGAAVARDALHRRHLLAARLAPCRPKG